MAAPGNGSEETGSMFRLLTAAPRPRELTGAVDLLSHYGLRNQYETFCREPLPVSIADSHYLLNVVGDTEIRKGEGMDLGQLLQGPETEFANVHIQPVDIEALQQAFRLRESGPISLPEVDKGNPTISGKVKEERKDKEKKHRKHKKHKDKDRHKDRERDKEKEKDHSKRRENGDDHSKKHHKKKKKHEDEEEGEAQKHKKKKHKHSSKTEATEPANGGK